VSEEVSLGGGGVIASVLPSTGSDHWPISLHWDWSSEPLRKPFRFEKFWLEHKDFKDLVAHWWKETSTPEGTNMYYLQKKLQALKAKIREWNRDHFGNIFQDKEQVKKDLEDLYRQGMALGWDDELRIQERNLLEQLEGRERQEEIYWRQKSRNLWLQEGEKNTKFFHNSVIQNRHRTKILKIKDREGRLVESRGEVEEVLVDHFSNVLKEEGTDRSNDIDQITRLIPRVVTREHNALLLKAISLQEVEEAVNQMQLGKAPGPDGFTSNFFHHFWELIKEEVWAAVEESRRKGGILKAFNATFLTLIPKEEGADTSDKFRPIALCNVIYKIISKVIANRLKPLLPFLISPEQSGFVEG